MNVRLARPDDHAAWARIWADSARAGFSGLLPAGQELPSPPPGRWQELLASPAVTLLVAEEDGEVVGYAACGENRDPGAAPETGELRTLFVAPAHWGSGAAQALVDAVLDDLRSRGYSAVTLWSFAENARANAFYQRAGFEPDGGERTEGVWGHVPELRLRRSL